jgi:GST-like protein
MADNYVVIGQAGSGSVPVEATLKLLGQSYQLELHAWQGGDLGIAATPAGQIPVLILPSGEAMTESAAILIFLADRYPAAGLSPPIDSPLRPAFLRWMTFVSAAIYALYWIRDDYSRIASNDAHAALIDQRTARRIDHCWSVMDEQIAPGQYILGDRLTVLDLYVAVVSRWGPRRSGFYQAAPRMADIVRRVDTDPRLVAFWAERFPFEDGWE